MGKQAGGNARPGCSPTCSPRLLSASRHHAGPQLCDSRTGRDAHCACDDEVEGREVIKTRLASSKPCASSPPPTPAWSRIAATSGSGTPTTSATCCVRRPPCCLRLVQHSSDIHTLKLVERNVAVGASAKAPSRAMLGSQVLGTSVSCRTAPPTLDYVRQLARVARPVVPPAVASPLQIPDERARLSFASAVEEQIYQGNDILVSLAQGGTSMRMTFSR